jgi:uncharacterized protein (DUF1684 family)
MFVFAQVENTNYREELQAYRDSVDLVFADTSTSILMPEDMPNFAGLHYYLINEKFIVDAKFRKFLFKQKFEMATSTDRKPIYRRYGVLKFYISEQKCKLVLYENLSYKEKHPEYTGLFCPFVDSSKHIASYGGGRYLDFDRLQMTKNISIDFNKSYNPYCAYNYRYSCPIPPLENHLKVNIEAGIQSWH